MPARKKTLSPKESTAAPDCGCGLRPSPDSNELEMLEFRVLVGFDPDLRVGFVLANGPAAAGSSNQT